MAEDAYAAAGVSIASSDAGVRALVDVLRTIDPGRESRSLLGSGHYASVLRVSDDLAIALRTDGVGSKLVVAEQTGRLDTVGIDCIAMNVNDLICVGAEPIAMLDYLAVDSPTRRARADRGGARPAPRRPASRSPAASRRSSPSSSAAIRARTASTSAAAPSARSRRTRSSPAPRSRRATRSSGCRPAVCTPTATRSPATPSSSRAA